MARLNLSERLADPQSPERRPRRAAYALPTLFTAGNVFLGFLSILKSFQAVTAGAPGQNTNFEVAAITIGLAVFLDGLDGRIARMTNTVSDFGREMDSLADVITFGIAPAVLAFTWGMQFLDSDIQRFALEHLRRAGYFICFLFLLCGAARLARFNVQAHPVPKNPGRADRKYFVGLPIPAAAALVAAVVWASGGAPIDWWPLSAAWLSLLALLAFLMVSTWRYRSFKDVSLLRPRSPLTVILLGALIYLVFNFPQAALLGMAAVYVASGIIVRFGGIVRRRLHPPPPHPEHQIG